MLAWHPADEIQSDTKSTQALIDLDVEFRGRASHAAYDPWNGRSAVDGLEIFTHAVNMMREHIRPTARMHYCEIGRFTDALPHLQRAIALEATDYQSRSNLGLAFEQMGKPELGIEPARQSVKLQPTNPGVLTNLGWVLLQAKRGSEAADVYERAVRLNPEDANTHYFLGLAYLAAGKLHMARSEEMNLRRLDVALSEQLAAEIAEAK